MSGYVDKKFEVVGDLILSGASVRNWFEDRGTPPPIRTIITDSGTLTGATVTIPALIQNLSLSGTEITISNGNTIDIADAIPEMDTQTLTLSGTQLSITRGNTVDLTQFNQSLTLSGDQLSISDSDSIDLSTYSQTLSLTGSTLHISDGNAVSLSSFIDGVDEQTLSLSGTELSITGGNTVGLSALLDNTDEQTLSLSGTELSISDGNTIDLVSLSQSIDSQTLALSGNTLTISNGNSIDLSTLQSESISPIFVTNVTNNNGLIEKQYLSDTVPSNYIISEVTVDDDSNLDITVEWDGPDGEWMGDAYINNTSIAASDISRIGDTRRFRSTVNVDLSGTETITVSANGSTYQVPVTLLGGGPAITDITFSAVPTYGGTQQPAFFDGDDVDITFTFDTEDVTSISLQGGNSTATSTITDQNITTTAVGDGTSTYTLTTTVDTSLTTITSVPVTVSAKNSFGTQGDEYTSTNTIPVRQGPAVTNVTFGNYPGTQTELKDNDTISITVEFDSNNVSQIQLTGGSSYASSSQTRNITTSALSGTVTITIDTSVTTPQNQPVRLRARGHNYGNYINSTNTVVVNNVGPTYSGYSVVYPANQSALKDVETADVALNISNTGASPTYTYSTPRGEITIPDVNVYNTTKTVSFNISFTPQNIRR